MELLPASQFSYEQLTDAYNQTRVDYIVPMPMNAARLREYVRVYDVDLNGSRVAIDNGEILGLGMLGRRENRGWITRLGVLPTTRRRGTGQALMSALMESAAERCLQWMWLEVIKGNEPAHRLFQRFGFEETRELLVVRRPPDPSILERSAAHLDDAVKQVTELPHADALMLLAQRRRRPNWLNETESLQHVSNLVALAVERRDGSRGWVCYQPGLMQLTRVTVEVTAGDATAVTETILQLLHQRHPNQDAVVENIPPDDCWAGYQKLGYFDTFRRIEMRCKLELGHDEPAAV